MANVSTINNSWRANYTTTKEQKFPGLTSEQIKRLEDVTSNLSGTAKLQKQQELYKQAINQKQAEEYNSERMGLGNDMYYRSLSENDKSQKNYMQSNVRLEQLADLTKGKFGLDATADTKGVINGLMSYANDNGVDVNLINNYLQDGNKEFLYQIGFEDRPGPREISSIGGQIQQQKGEWNDNLIGRFDTTSYDEADNKLTGFLNNTWKSAANLASDVGNFVLNPLDSVNGMLKTGVGAVGNAIGGVQSLLGVSEENQLDNIMQNQGGWIASANETADGMGDFLKDRYGSIENIRNTLYQDPVGVISDIASIVSLGGGAVKLGTKAGAKAAAKAGLKNVASNLDDVSKTAGKISKVANNYDPFSRAVEGTFELGKAGINKVGNSKIVSNIKNTVKNPSELVDNFVGLDKQTKKAMQDNPYTSSVWEKVQNKIETDGLPDKSQKISKQLAQELTDEVKTEITKYVDANKESGKMYGKVDNAGDVINFEGIKSSMEDALEEAGVKITDVVDEYGFPTGKKKLDFSKTAIGGTDEGAINRLYNWVSDTQEMPVKEYRRFRTSIDQLGLWDDLKGTPGKNLIKKIRNIANDEAHAQSELLKTVDNEYANQIKFIQDVSEGLVYRDKRKFGQFKDNINQIVKNLDEPNRKALSDRLEKMMPGIEKQVEAINMMPKLIDNYYRPGKWDKTISGIGLGIGGTIGGLSKVYGKIKSKAWDKAISTMSEEGKKNLQDIEARIKKNEQITAEQKAALKEVSGELKKIGAEKEAFDADIMSTLSEITDRAELLDAINGIMEDSRKYGTEELVNNLEYMKKTIEDEIKGEKAWENGMKTAGMDEEVADFKKRIHKIQEEEQRIGKVGNKKVNDQNYIEKQRQERLRKKEALITQIQEKFNMDQFDAAELYDEWEGNQKSSDYYPY